MLITAFALAAAAMGAGEDPYKTYPGGWEVYKEEKNCMLMRSFGADKMVGVTYEAGPKKIILISLLSPGFADIAKDEVHNYKLYFMSGDKLDSGWGEIHAKGMVLSGGEHGASFSFSDPTFLDDMTKNDVFALMDGDKVAGGAKLDQAGPAVAALRQCSESVASK